LNDAREGRARQPVSKAFSETKCIRVVAHSSTGDEPDGVHRANDPCFLAELIQQRNDRLLTRICDVQPGEPTLLRESQQLEECRGLIAMLVEIEQLVTALKALRRGFRLVDYRRLRGLDAATDEPEQADGRAASRHGSAPTLVGGAITTRSGSERLNGSIR